MSTSRSTFRLILGRLTFCVLTLSFVVRFISGGELASADEVSATQEEITIPTYQVGAPEVNPLFYTPQRFQAAQRWIYPYANLDKLSSERMDKEYQALSLENEYVKISVLPEIGGRLYTAQDKSNSYDYIYHNHVIKPALIGMAGAWISGGIEWNMVHHHRVSTFMPVDSKLVENEDGSKTIWVGEYEKRHHTKWVIGMTLFPNRSYVQVDVRLFNTTPLLTSSLFWANSAVNVNEDYQVIFPPDVEFVTHHAKNDFIDWPISDQFYRGVDFRGGLDISRWKNSPSPISFFAYETNKDFLAGIDHGKQAGTIFVGNHHVWKGKKMWSWGNNEVQRLWDKKLTDGDGPYIEFMMGAYSDNQPDYSWNNPYSARKSAMVFYPLKGMGNVKAANKDLSVNLELKNGQARIEINSTTVLDHCKMVLQSDEKVFYDGDFSIAPEQAVEMSVSIPKKIRGQMIKLVVVDKDGKELISYTPHVKQNLERPPLYEPAKNPTEIDSPEELYLAGLRLEQFGDPYLDPTIYWKEALKIDPNDDRANTQLGIRLLKKHQYEEASKYLERAVKRVTTNYTKPLDGNPLYYLGLCRFYQSNFNEAYNLLYKATWNSEWNSPAYFLLAVIDCLNGDLQTGLEHVQKSVESNNNNLEAWQLYSILLRKSGDQQRALDAINKTLALDPLNFVAHSERYLHGEKQSKEDLVDLLRSDADNYLELSARYLQVGFYEDASQLLHVGVESGQQAISESPLIHYYLGYAHHGLHETDKALAFYGKARSLNTDYCFPHGYQTERVLLHAKEENPEDPVVFYLLGNLYANFRPQESLTLWRKSAKLDPKNAICHRNIAFIAANVFDRLEEAVREIEIAQQANPSDPLYYLEGDGYAAYLGKPVEKRLEVMKKNTKTILKSDSATASLVQLLILNREYDAALDILTERHFHAAEASGINLHDQWTDAHILRGRERWFAGKPNLAKADFEAALKFPLNLESARDHKSNIALYYLGLLSKQQGDREAADAHFKKLAEASFTSRAWGGGIWPELKYYQALAYRELGQQEKSDELAKKLLEEGQDNESYTPHPAADLRSVSKKSEVTRKKASGKYSLAMGNLLLNKSSIAKAYFKEALELDPAHVGARNYFDPETIRGTK